MDRLQAMKTFVRVVETGSFSAVAREENATQSAISKKVAALEKVLDVKLLSRTTRSHTLTEEGERYFEQTRRLVAEIDEVESTLKGGHQQLSGWLHVAASVGFGRLRLMPVVQRFLADHASVKVDLKLHDGFVDLVGAGVDVAVRIGELADSSLIARRVGTSRRMVVAHRHYLRSLPKGLKPPREPNDLVDHNCIVYTEHRTGSVWGLTAGPGAPEAIGTTHDIRVEGRLQTNSSEVIRASVLAGMGIGYSPEWLFADELASGDVQSLLPDWSTPSPINLVSPRERRNSAKVRAFVEYVAKQMA